MTIRSILRFNDAMCDLLPIFLLLIAPVGLMWHANQEQPKEYFTITDPYDSFKDATPNAPMTPEEEKFFQGLMP